MRRKANVCILLATNKSHVVGVDLALSKENLNWEIESLLIATQKNDISTNYVKEKICKTQQNTNSWWRGDRDETINQKISEQGKLAQNVFMTRHDWVGEVIH